MPRQIASLASTYLVGVILMVVSVSVANLGFATGLKAIVWCTMYFALAAWVWHCNGGPVHLGLANRVTLLRGALACLLAGLVGEGAEVVAENITLIAIAAGLFMALDGLDGWLARRRHEASDFGGWLDHETDALFFLVLSVLVFQSGKVAPWIIAAGLLRYIYLSLRSVFPRLRAELPPSRRGQIIGLASLLALLACLLPQATALAATGIALAVVVTLLWSFSLDLLRSFRATGNRSRLG